MNKLAKKERGVALLYVIGIIALLMAMAMAFTSSSLFEQKAAANSAAAELADKLALSTLDQLVYGTQNEDPGIDYSWVPDTHYRGGGVCRDGLEILDTYDVINGTEKLYIFDWAADSNSGITDNVRWILHRVNAGTDRNGNPIEKVIGRSAFVVSKLGDGKINPFNMVTTDLIEENKAERRFGLDTREMNIMPLKEVSFVPGLVKYMNLKGTGSGLMPTAGGWNNLSDFYNDMAKKINLSNAEKELCGNLFVFGSPAESDECFWMDLNHDGKKGDDEKFHRFVLPAFIDTNEDGVCTPDQHGSKKKNEFKAQKNRWENTNGNHAFNIDRDILMSPDANGYVAFDVTDPLKEKDLRYHIDHPSPNHNTVLPGANVTNNGFPVFGYGIMWLAAFGYDKDGNFDNTGVLKATFPTVLARRRQIAANLKDYSDSDDIPTSDVDPSNWSLTSTSKIPTYTGLERTPYLNAIEARVEITGGWVGDTAYCELQVGIDAQLINMYKQLFGKYKNAKVTIGYKLAYDVALSVVPNANPNPSPISKNGNTVVTKEITIPLDKWPASNELAYASSEEYLDLLSSTAGRLQSVYRQACGCGVPPVPLASFSVKNLQLTITNVMVTYDGKNIDYAKINSSSDIPVPDFVYTHIPKTDQTPYSYYALLSWQTNDPRQNLNPGDWDADSLLGLDDLADCNEESRLNPDNIADNTFKGDVVSPAEPPDTIVGEYDPEVATSPAFSDSNVISTAYIRNAPMISAWELGFIHRGAAWQTINLKKYDRNKAFKPVTVNGVTLLPGGGYYSDGDANILDQIKMTMRPVSIEKVNLKIYGDTADMIFKSLFDLKVVGSLANRGTISNLDTTTATTGALLDEICDGTRITNMAQISTNLQARAPSLLTRASIADETELQVGADTDAACEEVIGKVINMTEVADQLRYFEAIIVSQAIKDVGNYDLITAPVKVRKSYSHKGETKTTDEFDAFVGEINFVKADGQDRIIDEITAQRKIRVRGYRRPDGTVYLISVRAAE
ncbi:MAG: hypothetical protein PHH65_06400 [Eubacteriales bacterium]|nr:hypothetical protein [Eubacteriales bacterium]